MKDLATLRNSTGSPQTAAIFDLPWTPLFIGVIYILSPTLGLLSIGGAIVLLWLAWLNDRMIREPQREAAKAAEGELNFVLASVRNAEVVEGMGMRPAVVERWQRQHLTSLAHNAHAATIGGMISDATRTFRFVLQVMIFGVGAYLVINRDIGAGAMMGAVYLVGRGLAPAETAISTWRQLTSAQAAYSKLGHLLAAARERPQGLTLPRPTGRLDARNLVFGRPGLPPVLKGVSFFGRCR